MQFGKGAISAEKVERSIRWMISQDCVGIAALAGRGKGWILSLRRIRMKSMVALKEVLKVNIITT